jgi:hypothetical protein
MVLGQNTTEAVAREKEPRSIHQASQNEMAWLYSAAPRHKPSACGRPRLPRSITLRGSRPVPLAKTARSLPLWPGPGKLGDR